MKTCKEISPALVDVKERLAKYFKPEWDVNLKGCSFIYFYTVDSWRAFKIKLEPEYAHPETGELLQAPLTKFSLGEKKTSWFRFPNNISYWYAMPKSVGEWQVTNIPFMSLFSQDCKEQSRLDLLDYIIVWFFTYIDEDVALDLQPVKDEYLDRNSWFTIKFVDADKKCQAVENTDSIKMTFNLEHFKDTIEIAVTHKIRAALNVFVYHHLKLIPPDVRESFKKMSCHSLDVPVVINVAECVESYVRYTLYPIQANIKGIDISSSGSDTLCVTVYAKKNTPRIDVKDAGTEHSIYNWVDSFDGTFLCDKDVVKLEETTVYSDEDPSENMSPLSRLLAGTLFEKDEQN